MIVRHGMVASAVLAGWLALAPGIGLADFVRFHFAPNEICGPPASQPVKFVGEWQPWRGSRRKEPFPYEFRPNQFVTFQHCYTGQNVTVPLRLPPDVPLIQHVGARTVFNYGLYSVEVQFLQDGSVETMYNSRLGQPVFWNGTN